MKKIILILTLLIIVSSANAIFGGESETIYEEDCAIAYVNITGNQTIEDGEFTLNSNCTLDSKWIYNCTCEEPIVLTTKVNTINTYFVSTDIWKEEAEPTEEPTEETRSSGSRSHNYQHQDDVIKATPKVIDEKEGTEEIEEEQQEPVITEEVEKNYGWLWITVLIIVVVGAIGYYVFKKKY